MVDMDGLLKGLDETYENSEAIEDGKLPEGDYLVRVGQSEICKSKSSERIHVKMPVEVVTGKFKGMFHYSYDLRFTDTDGAADERAMGYFKAACQKMQIPVPSRVSEAGEAVMQFENRVLEIRLVQNGDFTNMRIVRLIHPDYEKWIEEGAEIPTRQEGTRTTKKEW